MRTIARETAFQIALRNCSKEVGGALDICDFGEGGVRAIKHIFFLNLFIILLFLAVLGLRFCARAFPSCGKRGPLFIAVRGPLTVAASLVAEHRLQTRRLSSCGSRA